MAEAVQDEYRAHLETYQGFNKLVTFMVLWLIVLLASMALGLIAHLPVIGVLLGVGGSVAVLIGAALAP
ncbi:aa3 type cytochrome c oxidase subunit IV [Enhydrobacter aerosaccus]|uniref:Aa3 type cytochrome c oxidase subunit IV n=1 Tax=Enhydrobacter aerosaccus TaxID=225324 RepID=A0A1T4KKK7_9HYPH|nr:aa3-type cytochrome c oxidase subunit IV [Enhydrobacter aerosaccus]SJZ42928.1 aa3 type cytochrome c oxidase subunit IV [Enhydrobacter aerosaccus]